MVLTLVATLVVTAPATYEASLRTEGAASPDGALAQLNPGVSVTIPIGSFSLLASYTPRIVLFDPLGHHPIELLNRARVAGTQSFGRTKVELDQQVTYGTESYSWLVTAAEGGGGVTPLGQAIFDVRLRLPPLSFFAESTTLNIHQVLTNRLTLSALAAYDVSEGADDEARTIFPKLRILRFGGRLDWKVRTNDAIFAGVNASIFSFSAAPGIGLPLSSTRSYLVNMDLGWQHRFSPSTTSDIVLGVGGGREGSDPVSVYPYAVAGIHRVFLPKTRHYLAGGLSVSYTPYIDPLSGQVYGYGYGFANIEYLPVPKLGLDASAGGAVGPKDTLAGQQVAFAGLSINYLFSRYLTVSSGARGIWLSREQGNLATADQGNLATALANAQRFHWVVFAALRLSVGGHF